LVEKRGFGDRAGCQSSAAGGHDVPDSTIRQRYNRSLQNFFELYRPISTTWNVYDNTDNYRLIAAGEYEKIIQVHDEETWEIFRQRAADG
jgi:predicted ABC-type ATPase